MRLRAPLAAALAALVALAPALVLPALAASTAPVASGTMGQAAPAAPKVVIVVGATEGHTPGYRRDADSIAAEALKYTPNVIKVYSPNATWAKVKAAAQGASIFVYLGHGYGFPSPYRPALDGSVHDGMGLNQIGGVDDWDKKYYGEDRISAEIQLAKDAIVLLNHLCYSAGSSESHHAEPTMAVARERVDNYASGFIKSGARTVIAQSWTSGVIYTIRSIFTTDTTLLNVWANAPNRQYHEQPFVPTRNPQFQASVDPDEWTTGFHRSIVSAADHRTSEIVGGASAPFTNTDPASFEAPGAASVGASPVALYGDETLGTPTGASLAAGTKVRVVNVASGPAVEGGTAPPALEVATFAGIPSGWTSGAGLVPRDSASPALWSMDGPRTISPNADGLADRLSLLGRFSESASWSATIRDAGGNELKALSGTGHQALLTWDAIVGGSVAPEGDYEWRLDAWDGWGNPVTRERGDFTVDHQPTPETGVLSFKPNVTVTTSSSITYTITFAGAVSGLTASDFTRTGGASGCVVAAPLGGPVTYTIAVTKCTTGSVLFSLNSGMVVDAALNLGPAGPVSAAKVVIDRTAPTATAPRPTLRTGVALGGTSLRQPLPVMLGWTGADTGAGVASYDVKRSVNGATYEKIAGGVTSTSLATSVKPGSTYKFKVRARDKAGNVGSWVATSTWYPTLTQQNATSVKYGGAWATDSGAAYSGGSVKHAGAAGASASHTFSGRAVAWVTTLRPGGGAVNIYVDGAFAGTIDTYAQTTKERAVVFSRTWSGYGTHTIKLVVVGTADRPRADVDAFAVVR